MLWLNSIYGVPDLTVEIRVLEEINKMTDEKLDAEIERLCGDCWLEAARGAKKTKGGQVF